MPVWHALTQPYRDAGTLAVVGIAQEQHAERTRLFARWQGFDWPILWDPFNLSGSNVVPRLILVDEHGIVRNTRARPEDLEAFVATESVALEGIAPASAAGADHVAPHDAQGPRRDASDALSDLLWDRGDADAAIEALERDLARTSLSGRALDPADREAWASGVLAPTAFRLGVAYRLRHDGPDPRPLDFQRALDHWSSALALDPNQYIWRRRLQQYGPRLDKPYPFYSWIDEAQAALRARGEQVAALVAPLTATERLGPDGVIGAEAASAEGAAGGIGSGAHGHVGDAAEPDPQGRIERDASLVTIDLAVAAITRDAQAVRAHVRLRPNASAGAHWNNEADPLRIWLDVPADVAADTRLLEAPLPDDVISTETRTLDLELRRAPDVPWPKTIRGYALYYVCETEDGTCLYRRQDFTIPLSHLEPPG